MSENEEYDLRKSAEKVGELYPILVAKTGETIDGFHRENAKASWRREVREDIDTPEKVLKARLIANLHRRTVPASETRGWINDLAEIAVNEHGVVPGEISGWVAEETGYDRDTVLPYLNSKFKDREHHPGELKGHPTRQDGIISVPSDVLREIAKTDKPIIDLSSPNGLQRAAKALEREAKKKVKAQKTPEQIEAEKTEEKRRQRENAAKKREQQLQREQQLKEKARKEVTNEIKQEIKQELKQDEQFLREVAREIKPPLPKTSTEYEPIYEHEPISEAPKRIITLGLETELFNRITYFMEDKKMMREPAIIQLIEKGLESEGYGK